MTLVLPKFSARSIQCRSMKSRSSRLIAVVCCQAINFLSLQRFEKRSSSFKNVFANVETEKAKFSEHFDFFFAMNVSLETESMRRNSF